jgi:hypothetical protein
VFGQWVIIYLCQYWTQHVVEPKNVGLGDLPDLCPLGLA